MRDPREDMPERELQSAVCLIAKQLGWWYWHAPDNRPDKHGRIQRVVPGFPDLVLVRGCCLWFAELKTRAGYLTRDQRDWLTRLEATGARTFVWKPRDLLDGTIAKALL